MNKLNHFIQNRNSPKYITEVDSRTEKYQLEVDLFDSQKLEDMQYEAEQEIDIYSCEETDNDY